MVVGPIRPTVRPVYFIRNAVYKDDFGFRSLPIKRRGQELVGYIKSIVERYR